MLLLYIYSKGSVIIELLFVPHFKANKMDIFQTVLFSYVKAENDVSGLNDHIVL